MPFSTTYVGSDAMRRRCCSVAVMSSGRRVSYIPPGLRKSGLGGAWTFVRRQGRRVREETGRGESKRCKAKGKRDECDLESRKRTTPAAWVWHAHSRGDADAGPGENDDRLAFGRQNEASEAGQVVDEPHLVALVLGAGGCLAGLVVQNYRLVYP